MGRAREEESDFKSQLVREICSISTRSISCTHRHFSYSIKSPFIDWYHLLRVEENAEIDAIRKQYRRLALQLHPDKNKHSKAEVAFKLVSEGYACLSNEAKRKAFDFERWERFCVECKRIPYRNCSNVPASLDSGELNFSRSNKVLQGLRGTRERFKEEMRVVQNCLKVHESSRKETPLFDPSNYLFQGYPHYRSPIYNKLPEEIRFLRSRSTKQYFCNRISGKFESPIFDMGPERRLFQSKSTCVSVPN